MNHKPGRWRKRSDPAVDLRWVDQRRSWREAPDVLWYWALECAAVNTSASGRSETVYSIMKCVGAGLLVMVGNARWTN